MRKTNFSFELQYTALSPASLEQRRSFMGTLESELLTLLAVSDPDAKVVISDSHKGNNNKILEFVTSASDPEIKAILQAFCEQHGVTVNALE